MRTSRYIHNWVHSWGKTHRGVVTHVVGSSHMSHLRQRCRSTRYGPGPSLHMRWTTLGVERHVDLWTKRLAVHSVLPLHDEGPRPRRGRGPRVKDGLEQPLNASASTCPGRPPWRQSRWRSSMRSARP